MNRRETDITLTLLTLHYERQTSRSHTIFSAFWDLFFGVVVGSLGTIIGLIEIEVIEFHVLTFLVIVITVLMLIGVIGIIAFYQWFESRLERNKIEQQIITLISM